MKREERKSKDKGIDEGWGLANVKMFIVIKIGMDGKSRPDVGHNVHKT